MFHGCLAAAVLNRPRRPQNLPFLRQLEIGTGHVGEQGFVLPAAMTKLTRLQVLQIDGARFKCPEPAATRAWLATVTHV